MRLATFAPIGGEQGSQRVGVVLQDEIADVTPVAPSMLALVQGGAAALGQARAAAQKAPRFALEQVKLLAPFPRPAKNILCLGLNYRDHVTEGARAGARASEDAPKYPVWFTKAVTSVCGPYDDIVIDPEISTKYDWEVELMVVIGKAGRRIGRERAFEHVHSYTVFNDFSVRDIQRRHGPPPQWFKGKSFDKASPMGPWLVTADEIGTPPKIRLSCRVNGVTRQDSNTELMMFDIPSAIADISEVMTLEPGDVIATGTPSGVGFARTPPEYLKAGDVMETEIEKIGVLRNRIVEAR